MTKSKIINYYDILGIDTWESRQKIIKRAYYDTLYKYHPSHYMRLNGKEKLVLITEAFLVLSNEEIKVKYDNSINNIDNSLVEEVIALIEPIHKKSVDFVESIFNGTQKPKKRKNIWHIIGYCFLVMMLLGSVVRFLQPLINDNRTEEVSAQYFIAPKNWTKYIIGDMFSISIPPSLELRSDLDKYTKFLESINMYAIDSTEVVFQQKDLGSFDDNARKTYCRIIINYEILNESSGLTYKDSPYLSIEDKRCLRSIADEQLGGLWDYVEKPTYKWINISGTKAIDISYIRTGSVSDVNCHIYILFDRYKSVSIITAYRIQDNYLWKKNIDNIIYTFKWI